MYCQIRDSIGACPPTPPSSQKQRIREHGKQLDAHRQREQRLHPDLTMTGIYHMLEMLRGIEAAQSAKRAGSVSARSSTSSANEFTQNTPGAGASGSGEEEGNDEECAQAKKGGKKKPAPMSAKAAKSAWPATLPERIRAVRQALTTSQKKRHSCPHRGPVQPSQ